MPVAEKAKTGLAAIIPTPANVRRITLLPYDEENELLDLIKIVASALKMFPPLYVQSIFGPIRTWIPPQKPLSEFTILDIWRFRRAASYLTAITVPSHSHAPGGWARTLLPVFIQHLFWRPSGYYQQTDPYASVTSFLPERWFFLNGIATNQAVADMNSEMLSQMFRRPITGIHNATNSFFFDLFECAVGKSFKTDPSLQNEQSLTEPAIKATMALMDALRDQQVERIVWICHSQGTIITANVLRALANAFMAMEQEAQGIHSAASMLHEQTEQFIYAFLKSEHCHFDLRNEQTIKTEMIKILKKLEVYTFANCANVMTYITHVELPSGEKVGLPYIENFANRFDLVARLGVISPLNTPGNGLIKIDGPVYERSNFLAWGHLLNQHYLYPMLPYLEDDSKRKPNPFTPTSPQWPTIPRLYGYFDGQTQPDVLNIEKAGDTPFLCMAPPLEHIDTAVDG